MSKCLYTESDVTQSAGQLLICSADLNGEKTKEEKNFARCFPNSWNVAKEMLRCQIDDDHDTEVRLGDVIWTRTGGGKHIGFCVVKEDGKINRSAVSLCINSAKNKARELNIEYVGMGLFGCNTAKDWADIVPIVEFSLEEIQGVVCVPTNRDLLDVLDFLPGSKKFTMIKSQ